MKKIIALIVSVTLLSLTGCGIFNRYTSDIAAPDDLFGSDALVSEATSIESLGNLPWKEIFKDPLLQPLIDSALVRNTDLAAARLTVLQTEASLKSARLGYLPALSLSPSLNITPDNGYSLPLGLNWGLDGFGSITNRKREAQVLALKSADNEQTVRSQLVASVAELYNELQLLDRQLEIVKTTESIWGKVLETQKALLENGKAYSSSVNQMEASLLGVKMQKLDIANSISDLEGALCLLLRQSPQHICRSEWNTYNMPESLGTGIPAQILENRADVRAAGRSVEAAYYVTNQARAAMFPSLSLSGLIGWGTNGMPIANPGELIYNAIASLAQPLFAQGKLRANLKISQLQQEQAAGAYIQTILNAGNEVNSALRASKLAGEKDVIYKQQVAALEKAYSATQELMNNGKATYIEVLTAQEALLQAQLGEASNLYDGTNSLIELYIALGGGVR